LIAKLGQGGRTQTQLHGMRSCDRLGVQEQQADHHALHILQLNVIGFSDQHGPLNPGRAQMQITDLAIFGEIDLRELVGLCFAHCLIFPHHF
jgi:hypothetical protein